MASATDDVAADTAVELELEAMRKEDSSWHPCRVSLSSGGVGLILEYENTDSEDFIANKEEAMARLRARSIPLQGDDCVHIQPGEHILATQKSHSKGPFFDAKVAEAIRVRHSKRVLCRCTFIIKWRSRDWEPVTVSSSSIMKLSKKSINMHPTVSAFMNSSKSSSGFSTSPVSTTTEDMNGKKDLHESLEEQIEETINLTDVWKKIIPKGILFDVKVGTKLQIPSGPAAASKVSQSFVEVEVPSGQNQRRRSTRSTKKLQNEMETRNPEVALPPVQVELSASRPLLSPLAARAALALLRSKLSQNPESSICQMKKLDLTLSSDCAFGSENGVETFISSGAISEDPPHTDVSLEILTKKMENEANTSRNRNSSANLVSSAAKGISCLPCEGEKLTHSAVPNGTRFSNQDIQMTTPIGEKTMPSSRKTRRFTRSAVNEEQEAQTNESEQGEVAGNGDSNRGLKRKSPASDQKLRSSPRFQFLTRARSQSKS